MEQAPQTRCGTIALAGAPNAGKSTFLNAVVGTPLAITSPKAQTTRSSVRGIRTDGETQLVFVDPPGLLEPAYLLQEAMLAEAWDAIRAADAILHLHRLPDGPAPSLEELVPPAVLGGKPRATVLTCADLVPARQHPSVAPPTFLVASPAGTGLAAVLSWCRAQAPPGPFHFDPDDLSSQPLRFFIAEYVREAAFALLRDELPYALAAEVDEFRERSDPVYIRVVVYVERASHKGMVIGQRGSTIKRIGQHARQRAEALLERHVYLDLWVKVLPRWRQSADLLRRLGFRPPPARSA